MTLGLSRYGSPGFTHEHYSLLNHPILMFSFLACKEWTREDGYKTRNVSFVKASQLHSNIWI